MARFEMDGFDEMMQDLELLADLDEVANQMIDAASPIVARNMKKNIETAANRGYATGELAASVRATKAKQNNYGHFAAVGVTGTDSKGMRNAEKMAYLEYGTSKGQDAHPIMAKTLHQSEEEVVETMQQVFNREAGK